MTKMLKIINFFNLIRLFRLLLDDNFSSCRWARER